jgi:FMN phosphatase YigB (HAD superfamily)
MRHLDSALWERDQSFRGLRRELTRTPRLFQVISFDFFDTLVLRMCPAPADLFVEVGRRLAALDAFLRPTSPREFFEIRRAAETRARELAQSAGRSVEVRLADIYAVLTPVLRSPEAALEVERAVERDWCYLNPSTTSLLRFVRGLGYRVALLSDTYLSAEDLRDILATNGLDPCLIDLILVSSEVGCGKYESGLFREALRRLGVHANEMLHIGDNPIADVQGAIRAGVEPRPYFRTTSYHDEVFRREREQAGQGVRRFAGLDSLRILAGRLSGRDDRGDLDFRDGAFLWGPILAPFADWCVAEYRRAGVQRVLALMREGELLGELVRRSAEASGASLEVVTCFTSRRATALAALGEATPQRVKELLVGGPILTLRDVLLILGLEDQEGLVDEKDLDRTLKTPGVLDTLLRFLTRGRLREVLESRSAQRREVAAGYLKPLVGSDPVVGILDLGWSGSIQRNVTRILNLSGHQVRTVGCYLATTSRAAELALEGNEAHAFLENDWAKRTLLAEISITACVGSTDGYERRSDGQVVPVLGPFEIPEENRRAKALIREGVLFFQKLWLAWCKEKARSVLDEAVRGEIERHAGVILHRLLDYPTRDEARRLGDLEHDENYGVATRRPLCDEAAHRALREGGVHELFTSTDSFWPEGVLARACPTWTHALSRRWSDPLALGRLGALARHEGEQLSWNEEERLLLERLVRAHAPDQIVLFGPGAPGDGRWLAHLCQCLPMRAGNGPRGILEVGPKAAGEPDSDVAVSWKRLVGEPASEAMLRQVRRFVQPSRRNLLLLNRGLGDVETSRILAFLAPFLGRHGVIAACHGDCDPCALAETSSLFHSLRVWLSKHGAKLGFEIDPEAALTSREPLVWTVLRRALRAGAEEGAEPVHGTPPTVRCASEAARG